jgi:hypothetical protein
VAGFITSDQPLTACEAREGEPLILVGGKVLRGSGDHALSKQVIHDDGGQELVFVGVLRQPGHVVLETAVEGLGDRVAVFVRERLHGADPTMDAEDFFVDAKHSLHVPMLVGDLCRKQELEFVIGRREQERCQQTGDVVLGVEAVREDPDEAGLLLRLQPKVARPIGRKIELEH